MNIRYIGRLAPSPTGYLHLGHAATFLVAHERARAREGRVLLRFDDLDPQRSRASFMHAAEEDLRWIGITWEDTFFQSKRLSRYQQLMQQLLQTGLAYPCVCSRKDLQQATHAPHEDAEDEPIYNGRCRSQASQDAAGTVAGQVIPFESARNYRFRVPDDDEICFVDGNFGPQRFTAGLDFGDFLVWRKDGLPSYQLATVVDDADMAISEVVRGRDLLKSTARQILLQRALGLLRPAYFHVDLLLDENGQRLAKRHDALSLRTLRAAGVTSAEVRARVDALLHHRNL